MPSWAPMNVLPNVSQAAENTPEHRDRIVDAVRGVSLVVVVFGHLLLAVVYWPPDDPPCPPGWCTEWVASMTTGYPVRAMIGRDRISATRVL